MSKYIVVVISQKVLRPPSKLKLVTQKIKSELGEKKKKKSQENAFIDFCILKLRERFFSASVTISMLFKFNSQCRGVNDRLVTAQNDSCLGKKITTGFSA